MLPAFRSLSTLAMLMFTGWLVAAAPAADTPSGTVSLRSTSVAAGVGIQWGDGILTYKGKTYPFSVQGLEVVGVGYAEVKAEGTVYNLTRLEDFAGVYASGEASATAGSGAATVTMKNPNGVVETVEKGFLQGYAVTFRFVSTVTALVGGGPPPLASRPSPCLALSSLG